MEKSDKDLNIDFDKLNEELYGMKIPDLIRPKGERGKFSFFSGKGGVGKTTIAAATSYWLANQGYKTLIVSTDLQRSLDDVFQQDIGLKETSINGVPNLKAITIQSGESVMKHREEVVKTLEAVEPYSPILKRIREAVKSACGCEMASFWIFNAYLNDDRYDSIVFDTAPTGHTLEELAGQVNYAITLAEQIEVKKKLGEKVSSYEGEDWQKTIEDLKKIKAKEEQGIKNLRSDKTSFVLITHPEYLPLQEVQRSAQELKDTYDIPVRSIVINSIIPQKERHVSEFWKNRWNMQKKYIDLTRQYFKNQIIAEVPLQEKEIVGLDMVKRVSNILYG